MIDERNIGSLEDAEVLAKHVRQQHPASDGWYAHIVILNNRFEPVSDYF